MGGRQGGWGRVKVAAPAAFPGTRELHGREVRLTQLASPGIVWKGVEKVPSRSSGGVSEVLQPAPVFIRQRSRALVAPGSLRSAKGAVGLSLPNAIGHSALKLPAVGSPHIHQQVGGGSFPREAGRRGVRSVGVGLPNMMS